MKYFEPQYIEFFKDLEQNNNKEWFHNNKETYETYVKAPFEKFISDLIDEMNKCGEGLEINPKDCISRINRDIRFSKDKTPYNPHLTAFLSKEGRKNKTLPGFFIRITAKNIGMMVGAFSPDKDLLQKIRKKLMETNGQFEALIYEQKFVETFGEIKGEIQKRVPPELKVAMEKNFHISLKQFYFMTEIDPSHITSDKLMETVLGYYKTGKPVNDYLIKAIA